MKKYFFISNDKRSECLKNMLVEDKIVKHFEDADFIVSAIPFSKDGITVSESEYKIDDLIKKLRGKKLITGAIKEEVKKKFIQNNIDFLDVAIDEIFPILNAIPTAEGIIADIISNTDITLNGSNILILRLRKNR